MSQRDISRQDSSGAVTDRTPTRTVSIKSVSLLAALVLLAGLVVAEAVTVWGFPVAGVILYAVFLVLLLTQAYRATHTARRLFYSSVALVPLIRLLSLVLPLQALPRYAWYLLVLLPLSLAAWQVARINRVGAGMLGISARGLPLQLLIGLTGLVIGLVQYLILRPAPLLEETGWILLFIWPLAFFVLVISAVLEEFIFRGLIQYSALRNFGWFGLVFSSMLYASLFLGYSSLFILFFVFFIGILYGGLALRTGSLLGVSISHAIVNILVFMFFPYLVALPFFQVGRTDSGMPLPANTSLPPLASATPLNFSAAVTPTDCPAPIGWVPYLVEPGDTLESINQRYGSLLGEFLKANCLAEIVPLQVGQRLNVPPATPQPDSLNLSAWLTLSPTPTTTHTATLVPTEISLPTATPQPTEPPPPLPPRPSRTPQPTFPPPPRPSPTSRPTSNPSFTPTLSVPSPTVAPPSPTQPPPPTNTASPPTQAPTPTSAPTEPVTTQPATPTTAPTEEPGSSQKPTKIPRPTKTDKPSPPAPGVNSVAHLLAG